jgi:hypothetical protein
MKRIITLSTSCCAVLVRLSAAVLSSATAQQATSEKLTTEQLPVVRCHAAQSMLRPGARPS